MTAELDEVEFTRISDLVARCRVRNDAAIRDVTRRINGGESCVLLGPRFSEKTFLLADVCDQLVQDGLAAFMVDLATVRGTSKFVTRFAKALADHIRVATPFPVNTERQLQSWIQSLPGELNRPCVLLLDHLEILPENNVLSVLRILRAVMTETAVRDGGRVSCVVASSLAVGHLSLGPNSPFNESHHIWLGDLERPDAVALARAVASHLRVDVNDGFIDALLRLSGGDRYAIAQLCYYCASRAASSGSGHMDVADLRAASDWFVRHRAHYLPLQETQRSLEAEPDNLLNVVDILERRVVPQSELRIRPDRVHQLKLTGAVRSADEGGVTTYLIRSELYRLCLTAHYVPVQVARALTGAGLFAEALQYLTARDVGTDALLRSAFLEAVIGSIYAADRLAVAAADLSRHICHAFGVSSATVYAIRDDRATLQVLSSTNKDARPIKWRNEAPSVSAVYTDGHYLHDQDTVLLALRRRGDQRLGVLFLTGVPAEPQTEEFAAISLFARQLGWALGVVIDLDRKIEQLERLEKAGRNLTSSLDLDRVLSATVAEGTKAVGGAQRGVLFLYDDSEDVLRVRAQLGYRDSLADDVTLAPNTGYVGRAFARRETINLPDVQHDAGVALLKKDPDVDKQLSALAVPLLAHGRAIGVLCVDSTVETAAFEVEDERLLSAFAVQAAAAIQNAMLYRELNELSLSINRGEQRLEDIFERAAQSLVRVSGARAVSMLRTRNNGRDIPIIEKRLSFGLGDSFNDEVRPRANGLLAQALRRGVPVTCSSPSDPPGLNPAAAARGIRAMIALPLLLHKTSIGVLFVHYSNDHQFSTEECDMLSLFANQFTLAIERARTEEQLRVHASVAWMGLDLSELAHDIRQAAYRINTTLYHLRTQTDFPPELLSILDEIARDADSISQIPARARMPIREDLEDVNFMAVLSSEVHRWCAASPEVTLTFSAPPHCSVRCDRRRISAVLKTLTENAVYAAKRSRGRRAVQVLATVDDGWVTTEFFNTGEPIDPNIRASLFRFAVPSRKGSGMGLLIARTIAFGYGGELELVDSNAQGTTFRLALPTGT